MLKLRSQVCPFPLPRTSRSANVVSTGEIQHPIMRQPTNFASITAPVLLFTHEPFQWHANGSAYVPEGSSQSNSIGWPTDGVPSVVNCARRSSRLGMSNHLKYWALDTIPRRHLIAKNIGTYSIAQWGEVVWASYREKYRSLHGNGGSDLNRCMWPQQVLFWLWGLASRPAHRF